jgi:hypothetical protein
VPPFAVGKNATGPSVTSFRSVGSYYVPMLLGQLRLSPLLWIKLLHTVIWFFFATCILVLPLAALLRRFRAAALLTVVVLLECLVLALNHFRCPLSDLAARYTSNRSANFDIFLPLWLAAHNQSLFGSLFFVGALFVLYRYLSTPR